MREIKFRGKRVDNGEWAYGHLHVIGTCGRGYTGKAIQIQNGESRPFSVSVDPETVGQYTGLKDKNGKEIYEGDIVTLSTYSYHEPIDDYTGEVIFGVSGVGMIVREGGREVCIWLHDVTNGVYTYEISLLGNIHDNPELLGEAV